MRIPRQHDKDSCCAVDHFILDRRGSAQNLLIPILMSQHAMARKEIQHAITWAAVEDFWQAQQKEPTGALW